MADYAVVVGNPEKTDKPLGIHVLPPGDNDAVHWFLEDKIDTRSSNYLEDAATEIQVQGLELDHTCLLWDADMRYDGGRWRFYKFNGKTEWRELLDQSETKHEQMCARCGDVGFVVGGDEIEVIGEKGKYTEDEIETAAVKWGDYWREYWRLRGTKDAYLKDYVCEITIPIGEG